MKKFLLLLLILALAALAVPAAAETYHTLEELQNYVYTHTVTASTLSSPHAELEGTISEITYTGASNHYNMTLLVDEPRAAKPIWADTPSLTVHFRLHVEEIPWKVGDTVTVSGTLNHMYSSYMIPYITADLINGSDEF